uniref:Uncharacterized protein n=1 Tax=Picea glauca TaxID=3330 RepID=A0A124GMJ6_PICGL|nr:hypothetical protein ABT39_MTgene2227 [Picea glauca]
MVSLVDVEPSHLGAYLRCQRKIGKTPFPSALFYSISIYLHKIIYTSGPSTKPNRSRSSSISSSG